MEFHIQLYYICTIISNREGRVLFIVVTTYSQLLDPQNKLIFICIIFKGLEVKLRLALKSTCGSTQSSLVSRPNLIISIRHGRAGSYCASFHQNMVVDIFLLLFSPLHTRKIIVRHAYSSCVHYKPDIKTLFLSSKLLFLKG